MENQADIWDRLYSQNLALKKETATLPKLLKGKSVLEVGVGNGKTLISILRQNPKSVLAIDFSQEALNSASKLVKSEKLEFLKADITQLPFKEEFDVIVCYYTLNNLLEQDRKKAINSIYNALKEKGKIIFEDFAVGDFRERKTSRKQIETHTITKENRLICHFFTKSELLSLFNKFSKIQLTKKSSLPITKKPHLKRNIISGIIVKS